jgi:hypothetical protein
MKKLKITKCDKCGARILYNPKEMGWKKVKNKYLCNWCQDNKIETEPLKIVKQRVCGIYTTIIPTKPLIIKENLKGGRKENE